MNTKNIVLFIWSVALFMLVAGNAAGALRPLGDAISMSELQNEVFNAIGATSIDALNDQIDKMVFEPSSPIASSEYVATISWSASDIDFGIYNTADTAQKVTLFNYPAGSVGDTTTLQFNLAGNYVRSVNTDTLTVIDSEPYFKEFGFYATSVYGTFYSEDDLNTGSYAHFLTYAGEGDEVTIGSHDAYFDDGHYYVATEVTPNDTTFADFTDIVVQMESIIPIPEPGSLLLIGLSSASILWIRRWFVV
jgi:hypothetical protein